MDPVDPTPITKARTRSPKFNAQKRAAYLELLRNGGRRGASAQAIGMDRGAVHYWRQRDPAFADAESRAEMDANELVEDAMFRSALGGAVTGRSYKNGELVNETVAAPNVTAQQVWLYNRNPDRWADKRNLAAKVDLTTHAGDADRQAVEDATALAVADPEVADAWAKVTEARRLAVAN